MQNNRIWKVVKSQYTTQAGIESFEKSVGIENSRWFPVLIELYKYARKMNVKKGQNDRNTFKKEIMSFFQDKNGKEAYDKLGIFKLMFKDSNS